MIEIDVVAQLDAFTLTAAFTARAPGITCLFGPSGAGKTTLLRLIAGLRAAKRGRIAIDGHVLTEVGKAIHVAPEARRIGYVFQDARLFPHLSVRRNLEYGYARASERRLHLKDIAEALGIAPLLERAPRTLSGGERQRVALGRALLAQPRLILMDEPLSGVDAARKAEALEIMRAARARFDASVLYVSHDLDETAALADDLVLVHAGAVTAFGPAAKLFADPDLRALADRSDARTILDLPLYKEAAGAGLSAYGTQDAHLFAAPGAAGGARARFQIFARDVTLALVPPTQISTRNLIPAEVSAVRQRPDGQILIGVDTALGPLLSIVSQDAAISLGLETGKRLIALVKAVAIR